MATSASPSLVRGTTPSWTMKSGLIRPTAENAHLRPFHSSARSSALAATRTSVGRDASSTAISCASSASACARSPSSSTSSTAAASRG